MAAPKEVIAAATASAVAAPAVEAPAPAAVTPAPTAPPPAPAKPRVWKFVKSQVPAEVVTLPDGQKIQFRLVKTHKGSFDPVSVFETEDENVAKGLAAIEKRGLNFVFAVKP